MTPFLLISVFVLTVFFCPLLLALPFGNHEVESPSSGRSVEIGSACDPASGEVQSEDPCRPWCMCRDGVVICAEIFCSADSNVPDSCGKIKVNGRCCPTFVCIHNNGSASMHYPLPLTVVPPSMYEGKAESNEPPKEKRMTLPTLRRTKFL